MATDFANFFEVASKNGIELSPLDLVDGLWLAAFHLESYVVNDIRQPEPEKMEAGPKLPAVSKSSEFKDVIHIEPVVEKNGERVDAGVEDSGAQGVDVYAQGGNQSQSPVKGHLIRVPEAPILPRMLEMERALRPIGRRRVTGNAYELDEDETAASIASTGVWAVVERLAKKSWIEGVVVVEQSPTMRMWQETTRELGNLMWRTGGFRWLELVCLEATHGKPQLVSPLGRGPRRSLMSICRPESTRAIFFCTDCMSDGWMDGTVPEIIACWAKRQLTIVLHMLPEEMWGRTSLRCARFVVGTSCNLASRPIPNGVRTDYASSSTLIPVVSIRPDALTQMAMFLISAPRNHIPCYTNRPADFAEVQPAKLPKESKQDAGAGDWTDEVFSRFIESASPPTIDLARSLAAAPLFLPIMRLVQHTLVPNSEPAHLAELFSCGILRRNPPKTSTENPNQIEYEFMGKIREILLNQGSFSRVSRVWKVLDNYINNKFERGGDFSATLKDPLGANEFGSGLSDEASRPFARVFSKVLRWLGGDYSKVAFSPNNQHLPNQSITKDLILDKKGRPEIETNRPLNSPDEVPGRPEPTHVVALADKSTVLIGGDFNGNVYIGTPPVDRAQILAVYRRWVANTCAHLSLRGVDVGASDPNANQKHLDLDRVYVDLVTTTQVEAKPEREKSPALAAGRLSPRASRPIGALEAAAQHRHLVILGDPGSGKSTFLNHLGFCLAHHGLEPAWGRLEYLVGWPGSEGDLVPIPVVLRDFARQLPEKLPKAAPHHLWDFIRARLKTQNLDFAADALFECLDSGRALVLLDGLDEVSTVEQRTFVRDSVTAFIGRHDASRTIVTCRTHSYQDKRWRLPEPEFPVVTLAPFDDANIQRFIVAWFDDLAAIGSIKPEDATRLARQLQGAIGRSDLRHLAPNPLLLTVMALVHAHKGELPDARAQLYEDTVDLLLWRWEQVKTGGDDSVRDLRALLREVGRSDMDLKRVLRRVAFAAHGAGGAADRLADIRELALQNALRVLHPNESLDWAAEVIRTINQRAGLLLEREPQVYTFPHRTFQEYLAGSHLAAQPNFAAESAALVESGVFWREAILLAVGKLTYVNGEFEKPLLLALALCPESPRTGEAGWRDAWLAGDVLCEIGLVRVRDNPLGRELLPRVQKRLAALLDAGALPPVDRATAGVALGRLGDPRRGVGLGSDGWPDFDWIEIPAGTFTMGDKGNDWGGERFECALIRRRFRISRYPITVAQFQVFMDAKGYDEEKYWTDAGWAWRNENNIVGPEDYSELYQTPNHPRVGVSWFEAEAFCRWLAEKLDSRVSLPTEAQWERAARGTDGREYPWADLTRYRGHCNMVQTGIGHPSAVGMFPIGDAPCGAADMAGNVWEWCQTQWLENYHNYETKANDDAAGEGVRVLRGGAFGYDLSHARCAFRRRLTPDLRVDDVGFRVVASPFSEL